MRGLTVRCHHAIAVMETLHPMSEDERLLSGRMRPDERENIALRPKSLSDLIGQQRLRENLLIIVEAAKKTWRGDRPYLILRATRLRKDLAGTRNRQRDGNDDPYHCWTFNRACR